ncbi:MAG: lactonase family protein [Terracidiphilus sp.]
MTKAATQLIHSRRRFLKGAASLACACSVGRATAAVADSHSSGNIRAYVGSYTSAVDGGANGEGIYLFKMDSRTGELLESKLAAKTRNPSWICIHPFRKYLYAINEISDFNGSSGSVSAFSIDHESGELTLLNSVSSEGAGPAHMSLDASGRFAFVANYAAGSIAVLPILAGGMLGAAVDVHRDTGSIGSKRAYDAPAGSFAISGHDSPHAHMIAPDPYNKFVVCTDLGQDRIYVYRFDAATGKLTPSEAAPFVSLPSGDGPRHFAFHPNSYWFYSLEEESSTITFFLYDSARGSMTEQKTISALPAGFAGTNFASEIQLSPDGRFLYSANRLHDSISICSIAADGSPKLIDEVSTMGDYPRHFQFSPGGDFLYVCNQRSDSIVSFNVHRESGRLTFTGRYAAAGSPAFITFLA